MRHVEAFSNLQLLHGHIKMCCHLAFYFLCNLLLNLLTSGLNAGETDSEPETLGAFNASDGLIIRVRVVVAVAVAK